MGGIKVKGTWELNNRKVKVIGGRSRASEQWGKMHKLLGPT